MTLPVGAPVATVTFGPWTDDQGAPFADGSVSGVTFQYSSARVWTATGQAVAATPTTELLDVTGSGSIVLPVEDAGWSVVGGTYTATIRLAGRAVDVRTFALPAEYAGVTVDLDLLAPAASSTGTTVALPSVISVDGDVGVIDTDATTAARVVDTGTATGAALAETFAPTFATQRVAAIPVASRGYPYAQALSNGTDTSTTYRIRHRAVVPTGDVRLRFGNFYNTAGGVETVGPNTISVKASIETPDGYTIPVRFSGARTVVLEAGATVDSDPVAVDAMTGDYFFTRTYVSVASVGMRWPLGIASVAADGEGRTAGSDLTDSGTVTTTAVFCYSPICILGNAPSLSTPVIAGVGDSILAGSGDGNTKGFFYRALSEILPEQRIAYPSETALTFDRGDRRLYRLPLIRACTHAVCEYGVNDIKNGRTPANIEANLVNIWRSLARRGMKVYQTTITPVTTSTDSWVTTGNQTVTANEANRISLNAWIRAGGPVNATTLAPVAVGTMGALVAGGIGHPLTGSIETADTVETSRDSGIWRAAYTTDGTHPSVVGHTAMAAAIDPGMFT